MKEEALRRDFENFVWKKRKKGVLGREGHRVTSATMGRWRTPRAVAGLKHGQASPASSAFLRVPLDGSSFLRLRSPH